MNENEKLALRIGCRIDTIRKHIKSARRIGNSPEFVKWLRHSLHRHIEAMNALTSKVACVVAVVLVALFAQGCGTVNGIGQDLQDGSYAGARAIEDYGASHKR